ncbi:hypothetical protein MTP99_009601 [Tenebrio molitor]|jgi:secreted trypsin-like serine protease|nr:hypothetical protein MTP99_009601 [Tenebrio molitor]
MKQFLVFYLYLAATLVSTSTVSTWRNTNEINLKSTFGGRIIGGTQAQAGQFPYVAVVNVTTATSKIFCGGALLGDQWIVTAGQCVDQAISFTIQLGSNSLVEDDPNRQVLSTSTYVLHPGYNPETLDNDIGLIKLRMPVEFTDYIKPVYSVPVSNTPARWNVLALGWGQINDDDGQLSHDLNWVSLATLTNEECRMTYGNQITDNMLCVDGNYNEGACVGDTGSPLVYLIKFGNALLQGVSSFVSGRGCESTDPSGYTRVFAYADWITNITGVQPR